MALWKIYGFSISPKQIVSFLVIDNSMYKITHNLIAIPISDFLIPLARPSWHYHPLSYRLITVFFQTVAYSTLEQFNQAVCKIDHVSP